MFKLNKVYLLIFSLLLIISCASFINEKPENNSDSIIIGLSAYVSGRAMTEVYFIKLDEKDSYLSKKRIIRSNFHMNEQFFLVNAQPGRYIIVVGFNLEEKTNSKGKVTSRKYTYYYFPLEFIKKTDITVEKGNIYYLGDFTFWYKPSLSWGINNPDEAQSFYCNEFQPNQLKPNATSVIEETLSGIFNDETEFARAVNLNKEKKGQSEIEFWESTVKGLKANFLQKKLNRESVAMNEEWIKIINKKLKFLKAKETK